ncbi:MAG TPA: oligosaccharide flippase family protein [Terriglobales bacterium]
MKNSLARYGAFLFSATAARAAGILITSLTFPYLVRVLGVKTYGLWSYVVAVCAVLDLIADPGITTFITRHVAAHRLEATDLLADYFVLRACGAGLGVVVVLAVAHWEPRTDVALLLRLFGIGLLFVNLVSADHFLTALESFHVRSLLSVVQQIFYAAVIFLTVRHPSDVVWIPVAILGSSLLAAIAGWIMLFRLGLAVRLKLRPARWRQILVPSFHYAGSSLMSNVYHRSGHVLVRWFLGDYALGLYAAATRLVDLLCGFITTIIHVLMPRLALDSHSLPVLKRTTRQVLAATAAVAIPISFGLFATADRLVPWVLGASFLPAVALVKWLSPYVVTASAASLWAGTVLYALGRHRAYFAATIGGAISGIVFYLVLIPAFGLTGAGVAFVLAELVVATIAFAMLPRELHDLWRNPMIGAALASAAFMAIFVRVASVYLVPLPWLICGGVLIYVATCGWYARKWFSRHLRPA